MICLGVGISLSYISSLCFSITFYLELNTSLNFHYSITLNYSIVRYMKCDAHLQSPIFVSPFFPGAQKTILPRSLQLRLGHVLWSGGCEQKWHVLLPGQSTEERVWAPCFLKSLMLRWWSHMFEVVWVIESPPEKQLPWRVTRPSADICEPEET